MRTLLYIAQYIADHFFSTPAKWSDLDSTEVVKSLSAKLILICLHEIIAKTM